jgi:hypothetical protein
MRMLWLNLVVVSCFVALAGCDKHHEAAKTDKADKASKADKTEAAQAEAQAAEEASIKEAFAKLSEEDRMAARSQKFCAVDNENRLGSMGPPVKVMIEEQPVFLCCKHCEKEAIAKPKETLEKVAKLKKENAK